VSEAEIKLDRADRCLNVDGYKIEFSKTRETQGIARTLAYVKCGTKFERQPQWEDGESEMIVFSDGKVHVCGIYRPFKTVKV